MHIQCKRFDENTIRNRQSSCSAMHSPEMSDSNADIAKHKCYRPSKNLHAICTLYQNVCCIRQHLHSSINIISMIIPCFSLRKCLWHRSDKVINFTERSWKTFKSAAGTGQDKIYEKTFHMMATIVCATKYTQVVEVFQ